jgi:Cellulase (glycosyl hydrolase family 5)
MALRRKTGLIVISLAALATLWGYASRSLHGQQNPSARTVETRGSDWSVETRPDSSIVIRYKGVVVLSSKSHFWGPNYKYAQTTVKRTSSTEGHKQFAGEIQDYKLKITNDLRSPAPNVIRIDLVVQAQETLPNVIGGGWEWNFILDSPALGGKPAPPELISGNLGWTWPLGRDQAITLRFDEPAAKVYYERNQKNTVRTHWFADRVDRGPHRFQVTLELPEGAHLRPGPDERYPPVDHKKWFPAALDPEAAPVDLSFLNRDDRPAGRRGFVRADGDRLVFADGTPARFWGTNLAGYALFPQTFREPEIRAYRKEIARQAHRMAQLGYNLVRIHHHDSKWVAPNVFGPESARTTRQLDPISLDILDWTIKCLEDEGIYVWLDMWVGRIFKPGDRVTEGASEIARAAGWLKGFCYYNRQLQELMREFQHQYLNHNNRYTGRRYKDDPAVIGVLISNENDLTVHGGNGMLPDKNNPYHNALWTRGYQQFAQQYNLPPGRVFQTWLAGPSKLYLSQAEHEFNQMMLADLRQIGVKSLIATTNFWGEDPLFALAPLTDGGVIDVHSYGNSEEFNRNAHYQGTFVDWIAMGQVYGKPLTITEWNVTYPQADRFTTPLYVASLAALQGWDAPMILNYSQGRFGIYPAPGEWSSFHDPALTAIMPAAALLFRRGHVGPARKTYCLMPGAKAFFGRDLTPGTSATIRTLAEQSKLTIGIPETPELPWLEPSRPSGDVTVITDPDHDFIPEGQSFVRSDTGELTRDWEQGIQTIDTPRTQAVSGWIGGKTLQTHDASFEVLTRKAVVALSSVDDRPLSESHFVLITAVARAVASPGGKAPYLSEPVYARITLKNTTGDLEFLSLGPDGRVAARPRFERGDGAMTIEIPAAGGTHWYVLKSRGAASGAATRGAAKNQ